MGGPAKVTRKDAEIHDGFTESLTEPENAKEGHLWAGLAGRRGRREMEIEILAVIAIGLYVLVVFLAFRLRSLERRVTKLERPTS